MTIKKIFNSMFKYQPQNHYQFTIPDEEKSSASSNESFSEDNNQTQKVSESLMENLEYIKIKYNSLINSDIIIRQFTLNARGKQYDAFIVYIDGMVDSQIMDEFILKPLMIRTKNNQFDGTQNKIIAEKVANDITVRKVKKFNLSDYLIGCLLPQNSMSEVEDFDKVCNGVNSRELCFICRNLTTCF